jgi:N-acetylmuramoyl-L-alanine amidase
VEGVREADIAQAVARQLVALSDERIRYEPKRRPPRAGGLSVLRATLERSPPPVIISLHCDSSEHDPHRHICRSYYWPALPQSAALAETIAEVGKGRIAEESETVKAPWDRNGKPYTYPLLKVGTRASVLIELGYLSDVHTRRAMVTRAWQKRAAAAIDEAIRRWLT